MSQRRRRAGKLAHEKIPKIKSTHVQMHARNPVMIVGAVEEHRHHNTGAMPEEVEEETMMTTRVEEQRRRQEC
jgi:hypothetical protein